jgi:hypothetical protein
LTFEVVDNAALATDASALVNRWSHKRKGADIKLEVFEWVHTARGN